MNFISDAAGAESAYQVPGSGFRISGIGYQIPDWLPGSVVADLGFDQRCRPLPRHRDRLTRPISTAPRAGRSRVRYLVPGIWYAVSRMAVAAPPPGRRLALDAVVQSLFSASGGNLVSMQKPPIYLSGSISGGREDVEIYQRIEQALVEAGYQVIGGDVCAPQVTDSGCDLDDEEVWERDLARIETIARRGGILVAEVSRPSLGVGYEIATARWKYHMQVAALWRGRWSSRCSAMIAGDPNVVLVRYDESDLSSAIESLIVALEGMSDDSGRIVQ